MVHGRKPLWVPVIRMNEDLRSLSPGWLLGSMYMLIAVGPVALALRTGLIDWRPLLLITVWFSAVIAFVVLVCLVIGQVTDRD